MLDGMAPTQVDGIWMELGEQATPGTRCVLLTNLPILGHTPTDDLSGPASGLLPAFGMRQAAHLPTPQRCASNALARLRFAITARLQPQQRRPIQSNDAVSSWVPHAATVSPVCAQFNRCLLTAVLERYHLYSSCIFPSSQIPRQSTAIYSWSYRIIAHVSFSHIG